MKKLLILIMSLAIALSLIACNNTPCTEHEDTNPADGKCDICGAEVTPDEGGNEGGGNEGGGNEGGGAGDGGSGDTLPTGDLVLVEGGEAKFQFVLGDGVTGGMRSTLNSFKNKMKSKYDITIKVVDDVAGNEMDCEVLVGTVKSRGATYEYDRYSLGLDGSVIKAIGTKIVVCAGDDTMMPDMLNEFIEDYLGFDEGSDEFLDVTLTEDDWYEEIQDDYDIESIDVAGTDLKGYTISYPSDAKSYFRTQAVALQELLYSETGYFLKMSANKENDKCIAFRLIDKTEIKNGYGFEVSVEGEKLVIKCAHMNSLERAMTAFVEEVIYKAKAGPLSFGADYKWSKINIGVVKYKDFGVDDKGIYNAYPGIKAAHDFANEGGQTVQGEYGATYLITQLTTDGKTYESIKIMTDVDWRGATFIIDDTNTVADGSDPNVINVFEIVSDLMTPKADAEKVAAIKAAGINSLTTHIDLGISLPLFVRITNNDRKIYIRYGGNQSAGGSQQEVLKVDETGKIDPTTPILFDYEYLTAVSGTRIDDTAIEVKNATFRSLASQVNLVDKYYSISRGIAVKRANTTISDLTHIIENEKAKGELVNDVPFIGHSYGGFISVTSTSDVTVKGVTFQSRVYYLQGTYDIGATFAINLNFIDCDQSNFFTKDESGNETNIPNMSKCWGVMGSNYCKNLYYINSTLTRYDAHCGVVNGGIIGGKVSAIRLIGGGDMLIEDAEIYNTGWTGCVQLREDYGATFKGTVTFRNSTVKDPYGDGRLRALFHAPVANHDFGYKLYFPNVVVDNLKIENANGKTIHLLWDSNASQTCEHMTNGSLIAGPDAEEIGKCSKCGAFTYRNPISEPNIHLDVLQRDGRENLSPYYPPEYITVQNNAQNGYNLVIYDVPFFANTEITGEITKVPKN